MIECTRCKTRPAAIVFDDSVTGGVLCYACAREQLYEKCHTTPSDINEHLPLLRALAHDCEIVIEFGMRWARGSTVAFLAGQPKRLISWDIDPACVLAPKVLDLTRLQGETFFQPRVGNTLEIPPERCDLLFFDSLHTQKQVLAELMRHVDPPQRLVRKYLVFHDTSTFGSVGEDGGPGIYGAIRHFQRNEAFPLWQLMPLGEVKGLSDAARAEIASHAELRRDGEPMLSLSNNNGLIVLKYICADGHGALRGAHCTVCGERVGL